MNNASILNIEDLFVELHEQQIKLFLQGDDIKITSYKNKISPDQIAMIKSNKDEIIKRLKSLNNGGIMSPIPVVDESESYPLSNAQQRVWILSQLEEGSTAYNLPTEIELIGSYDLDCFERAIKSVIERHEILRTVFKEDVNGEPCQIVLSIEEIDFNIDFRDFRNNENPEEVAKAYVLADAYKSFDLAKGPLLRASLLQVSDDKYIFYYNMHHIISDGWSMEILAKDVIKYYEAYILNIVPEISPLRIQYKDYSAWQLNLLTEDSHQNHKEYWVSLLNDEIPTIDLPSNKKRPKEKTYTGKCLGTHISKEVVSKLQNFSKNRGGSLFMGLLTTAKILLHHYSGEKDIVVGNPIAGREHGDLENQIGVYINSLALRNQIDQSKNFIQLYDQIRTNTLKALEHQMYPFDKLLEDLNFRREANRNPVFDILINYLGTSEKSKDGIIGDEIQVLGKKMLLFDVEIDFTEVAGGVDFLIRYNNDVYEYEMIKSFMLHYKRLLYNLLNDSENSIGSVDYLFDDEKDVLINQFNDTQVNYNLDSTVIDLFKLQVDNKRDSIAIEFENEKLTYKELDEKSDYLANYLMKNGVKEEDLVAICLEKRIEMIIGILAVMKCGGAYVPIDPNYPKDRIDYILKDIASKVILTSFDHNELLEGYDEINIINLDDEQAFDTIGALSINTANISSDNLAYVIYTSGSTGKPKGVKIEHKALLNFLFAMQDQLDLDENLKFLSLTTFTFDISLLEFFAPLTLGGKLILVGDSASKDPEQISKIVNSSNPNFIQSTPSRWEMMLSNGFKPQKEIVFLTGGEAINYDLKEQLTNISSQVWNMYGPTETTIWSCMAKLEKGKNITLGKPIANTQVYILNEQLAPVSIGALGQLCISGFGLSRGYVNQPDLTAEKFVSNPFKKGDKLYLTGDLASWRPDGNIQFYGRNDHQVKLNGYRIELGEIEAALSNLNSIRQSAVKVLKDDNGAKSLVGYIVSDSEMDQKEIQKSLRDRLPEYMIPKIYVQLDEMPLTQNGKVNRKELPAPAIKQEFVKPYNQTQEKLVEIWKEVLQIEGVGIRDDFFQVGGNSLRGIRVLNTINKEFGLKYDLRGIYVENTIELISERIEIDLRFKETEEIDENEFSEIKI